MHRRALLRAVDQRAGEHRVTLLLQSALPRQFQQQRLGRVIDQVLGQVRKDMRRVLAEAFKAPRIFGEGLAQVKVLAGGIKQGMQSIPRGSLVAA